MAETRTAASTILKIRTLALVGVAALSLTGCFDSEKTASGRELQDPGGTATPAPTPPATPAPPPNSAPTISGSPPTSAKVNVAYSFQPAATDPDGDSLTFTIANKPAWAAFDAKSGRLSGTPSSSSTGVFANIRISVTDGKATSSMSTFSINVAGDSLGSATLKWQPPTSNTDGSPLTNLAGYVIRYGTSLNSLSTEVRIANPGLTTYMVTDLQPATWYFQVAAYNTSGVESAPSATASKTIT